MRFVVVTLFPGLIDGYLSESVVGRARRSHCFELSLIDPRDFTSDRHRTVDDVPYGGGAGMVMKAEPLALAIESASASRRILLSPSGKPFRQADAGRLLSYGSIVLVCGRYEGIDERVIASHIDEEISIGDFVVTGGELAALCVIDAIVRLLPHALGNAESSEHESFTDGLLEYPHSTRPARWRDTEVPPVLLGGNHAAIASWRAARSLERTQKRRPDLLHDTSVRTAPSLGGRTTSYEERK